MGERTKPGARFWQIVFIVLIAIVVVVMVAFPWMRSAPFNYLKLRVVKWKWTQADAEAFERWRTEVITLPDEAYETPPFGPETVEAARRYNELSEKHKNEMAKARQESRDYRFNHKDETVLTAERYAKTEADIAQFASLMEAMAELAAQPDYEVDVLSFAQDPSTSPDLKAVPNFQIVDSTQRLFHGKVVVLLNHGDEEEAFEACRTLFRSSRCSPYSCVICRLMSLQSFSRAVSAFHALVLETDDPAKLRRYLDFLNRFPRRYVFLDLPVSIQVTDYLGTLRQRKRFGGYDFPQKATEPRFFLEWMVSMSDTPDPKMLQLIPAVERRATGIERWKEENINTELILAAFFSTRDIWTVHSRDLEAHERPTWSRFDLARLEAAAKLFALEKGRAPASVDDLVPEYLSEAPGDLMRKDGAGFCFDGERFYSVGPDQNDGKMEAPYDPTNGTASPGDLWLEPPKWSF